MEMARSFKLFHTLFLVFAWQCCAKVAATFDDVTGVVDLGVDHGFSFRAFATHGFGIPSVGGSVLSTVDPQSPAAAPWIAPSGFETPTSSGGNSGASLDLETQISGGGSVVSRGLKTPKRRGDAVVSYGLETPKRSGGAVVSYGLETPKISGGAVVSGSLETSSQSSGGRVVSRGLVTPKSSGGRVVSRGVETLKSRGGAVIVSHGFETQKISSGRSTVSGGSVHGNKVDEDFDGLLYNTQPKFD